MQSPSSPLLPVFAALARVEALGLQPAYAHEQERDKGTEATNTPKRTVHFPCHAWLPPVDRVPRSDVHQREYVAALAACAHVPDDTQPMHAFVEYLENKGTSIAPILAESTRLPVASVTRQVAWHRQQLLQWLRSTSPATNPFVRRLSECVGQGMRYLLRRLFDGPPQLITTDNTTYLELESEFSMVPMLVTLSSDTVISSVLSICLSHIYQLDRQGTTTTTSFCTSPAAQRGFGIRSRSEPVPLTDTELTEVLNEINVAFGVLLGAHAADFVLGLLQAPGVQDELHRLDDCWMQLQRYAQQVGEEQAHVGDVHLVSFFASLDDWWTQLQNWNLNVQAAHVALEGLTLRFGLRTKTPNVLRRFPQIVILRECLQAGYDALESIPSVVAK